MSGGSFGGDFGWRAGLTGTAVVRIPSSAVGLFGRCVVIVVAVARIGFGSSAVGMRVVIRTMMGMMMMMIVMVMRIVMLSVVTAAGAVCMVGMIVRVVGMRAA